MDIGSGDSFPASALSNFCPHPFIIDGVQCNSMEGFLQSLKFKNPLMQEEVCKMVGRQAKFKGKKKKWWRTQTVWWRGVEIPRQSQEFQDLIDRAFDALGQNEGFRKALLATQNATLTHSIGKSDPTHTILTTNEFISRLNRLRTEYRKQEREKK